MLYPALLTEDEMFYYTNDAKTEIKDEQELHKHLFKLLRHCKFSLTLLCL